MWREMGLSRDEYGSIVSILGREPNEVELGMFAAMWSEHCSYKNSKEVLRLFPTAGDRVVQGPGENAGAMDIGDGLAVVFKIESHNHPSAVEPFQGAATGVGGIVRDVLAMGAEPIALLGVLRAGPLSCKRSRWILRRATEGMTWYGDALGIPAVGGDLATHPSFRENPLVNAMCVGIVEISAIKKSAARGPGNPVIVVGARTGRDGIQGAAFASQEIAPEVRAGGEALQIGDSKSGHALKEACLELYDVLGDSLMGIQDMGAAGLTCSSAEMASKGSVGMEIDVAGVPRREEGMTPYEVMLSESQERMLVVVPPGREADVIGIFRKWGLEAEVTGKVTDNGILRVKDGTATVAEVPAKALTEMAPCYSRETRAPALSEMKSSEDLSDVPEPSDYRDALRLVLSSPKIACKGWLGRQASAGKDTENVDYVVCGPGAQVVRVPGTSKGLAVTCEVDSLYCSLDPWQGAAHAVVEAARNLVACGAVPLGITDCLNFGNPLNPEVMWQFKKTVEGMSAACRRLDVPVTGGNVSFYNESDGVSVHPTPSVGMVGLVEDMENVTTSWFKQVGDVVAVLGRTEPGIGASEYLSEVHGIEGGQVPRIDLDAEEALLNLVKQLTSKRLLSSARGISEGGIAAGLADACALGDVGADVALDGMRLDHYLFSESGARMLVSFVPSNLPQVEAMAKSGNVPLSVIGKVGGQSLVVRRSRQLRPAECSGVEAECTGEDAIEIRVSEISRIYREACSWLEEED
ncbi:MAG: phosphoribosylformylglycinamidine synthase subunit PurL [Firmicutes bacterium]|nr:phosphoribosylformylglycinamidine synthase subunit PurL [Bacillota bacterium]